MEAEKIISWLLRIAGIVLLLAWPSLAEAQLPLPLGPEFRPDPELDRRHWNGTVATRPDGELVLVWERDDADEIVARRYGSHGVPVGEIFKVNDLDIDSQAVPDVAMADDGGFVVVWRNKELTPDAILGRRFSSGGAPIGEELRISPGAPTADQSTPSIAGPGDGGFWVVWAETGLSIHAQRFAPDGSHLGAEILVDFFPDASQCCPDVDVGSSGDVVVVWQRRITALDRSIQGRRFDSGGGALGAAFQVQSYTTRYLENPAVAVAPGGDFLVAWESAGSLGTDTESGSIQGQFFGPAGDKKGDQFQVNSTTFSAQQYPAVGVDADGRFVVVWDSFTTYGGGVVRRIQGQRYRPARPLGVEFDAGEIAPLRERQPNVAVSSGGDFVVTWRSLDLDAPGGLSSYPIRARRFSIDDELLFGDGFEGGGLNAWFRSEP